MIQREIGIRQRLRFNALRRINDQNRASQAAKERETS